MKNEKGKRLCAGTDSKLNTPLHIAAKKGNEGALQVNVTLANTATILYSSTVVHFTMDRILPIVLC